MSIQLSKKHGVNPSLLICPVCGESSGVALCGRLQGDAEAPKKMLDRSPCQKCQETFKDYKTKGFVLYVIGDEYDAEDKNTTPWMYFHSVQVLRRDAVDRIFRNIDTTKGAAFIALSAWQRIAP
jgi:hypothetical protein